MGYHRDPQHFKSLSPYEGEIRRRMWAMIYSLDIGFAAQMGLPSSIKTSIIDTLPPRNLQDRDFDADSIELPPARPMNELTSSTVILSKLHVATSLALVSDIICSPNPLSHEDLEAANSRLDLMHATIPEPCKLRPVLESLLDPPSVVFQVSVLALITKKYQIIERLLTSSSLLAYEHLHALSKIPNPAKLEISPNLEGYDSDRSVLEHRDRSILGYHAITAPHGRGVPCFGRILSSRYGGLLLHK